MSLHSLLALAALFTFGCNAVPKTESASPQSPSGPAPPVEDPDGGTNGPGGGFVPAEIACCWDRECGSNPDCFAPTVICGTCDEGELCVDGHCFEPTGDFRQLPIEIPLQVHFMGCNPELMESCPGDEMPGFLAETEPFVVFPREISVSEYASCVDAEICSPAKEGEGCHTVEDGEDMPVNCVTHQQAKTFCDFTGNRLCTEHEWEAMARGGCGFWSELGVEECKETPAAPWGNMSPSCEEANLEGCSEGAVTASTPSGGSAAGARNVIGNIAEWTSSYYSAESYESGEWPVEADRVVVRGGSFASSDYRASQRRAVEPSHQATDIGIRCCGDTP